MRTIQFGGGDLRIAAAPITPWIYKKAFDADMIGELAQMSQAIDAETGAIDFVKIGPFGLIQMVWAMAKTVSPKTIPSFTEWLGSVPDGTFDFSELDMGAVMEELQHGFFRGAVGAPDDDGEAAEEHRAQPGTGDTGLGETDGP